MVNACVCTSAEGGSVLSVVLDLCILPQQQTSQLLHLMLQQTAHRQQGAHQLHAHLQTHTGPSERQDCGVITEHVSPSTFQESMIPKLEYHRFQVHNSLIH